MDNELPIIGITCGDLNGIGLEVVLKTLSDTRIVEICTPVILASTKVISYHKKALNLQDFHFQVINSLESVVHGKVNVFNAWKDQVNINLGQIDDEVGRFSVVSIDAGITGLKEGNLQAVVTAPINKNNISIEGGKPFTGHTGYFGDAFEGSPLMLLCSDTMRVGLVTEHIPVAEVAQHITKEKIQEKIQAMNQSLIQDFGIRKPKIAVLGLNPHAGDEGKIGTEDQEIVTPAISEIREKGMLVQGPFPADGFFGSRGYKQYDGILAMYHDQGLAPFKALNMGEGVNFTAGLSIVRTSPDHGTGMSIAGKGEAHEDSFRNALFASVDIYKKRSENLILKANSLQKQTVSSREK